MYSVYTMYHLLHQRKNCDVWWIVLPSPSLTLSQHSQFIVQYMFFDWQLSCFFNFIKVLDWMFTYHFRANLWNVSIARPIYTIFKKNSEDRTYFVGPKIFIKDKWHWRRNNILYIYAVYIKSMYLYQAKQRQKLCELINASFPNNLHLFNILN